MAKRTNLLMTVDREIKNGKTFIDKNGYFATEEAVLKSCKEAYIKALQENSTMLEEGITYQEFATTYQSDFISAFAVLKALSDDIFYSNTLDIITKENVSRETLSETFNTDADETEETETNVDIATATETETGILSEKSDATESEEIPFANNVSRETLESKEEPKAEPATKKKGKK